MAKCLIFEPDVTGHRLQHVRHLTDALLEIGCDVELTLQADCRLHREYDVHLKSFETDVELHAHLDPRQSSSFAPRWRRVGELIDAINSLRPDWVYVPYADGMTQVAALQRMLYGDVIFGRVPIEAQVMRGKYGYPQRSPWEALDSSANRWFTRRSPWQVTHVLDPIAFRALEPLPDPDAFRLIPEPVEPLPEVGQQEARQALGVPSDGRYLAFVGGVDPRKGIDLLLTAFSRAKLAADDRLLFVGKMAPSMRDLVYQEHDALLRQKRIIVVDRYVTDFELGCGFLAADIVAVTHPRQIGSSGTLVRGAAARRPILASDFGWVGWATKTFRLGTTVDVTDIGRHAAAIETLFRSSGPHQPSEPARRFCQYHTIANQKAHWLTTIGRDRGLPLAKFAERIDWHWVMEAVE